MHIDPADKDLSVTRVDYWELRRRFKPEQPSPKEVELGDQSMALAYEYAVWARSHVHQSRELDQALVHLDEVVMWLDLAIRRRTPREGEE